jgi:hypothetical protein
MQRSEDDVLKKVCVICVCVFIISRYFQESIRMLGIVFATDDRRLIQCAVIDNDCFIVLAQIVDCRKYCMRKMVCFDMCFHCDNYYRRCTRCIV